MQNLLSSQAEREALVRDLRDGIITPYGMMTKIVQIIYRIEAERDALIAIVSKTHGVSEEAIAEALIKSRKN